MGKPTNGEALSEFVRHAQKSNLTRKQIVNTVAHLKQLTEVELHRYDGSVRPGSGGHNASLSVNSVEAQIIADATEVGFSTTTATTYVNQYLRQEGKPTVRPSAVRNLKQKLRQKKTRVKKRKDGSDDPDSRWSKHRYMWATQMLIRFGHLTWEDVRRDEYEVCPRHFDIDQLGRLEASGVASWDETHPECQPCNGRSIRSDCKVQTRFYRDENGRPDENGSLAPEKYSDTKKNSTHSEWSFGCAMVEINGELIGRRCRGFCYTDKWLRSISTYEQAVELKIASIRKLSPAKAKQQGWITGLRPPNLLFKEDTLDKLVAGVPGIQKPKRGLGSKALRTLKESAPDVKTVGDLANLAEDRVKTLGKLRGFSEKRLNFLQEAARGAQNGAWVGNVVDHRESDNPWKSRWPDNWEERRRRSLRNHASVKDLVTHIIKATQEVFNGTKHEKDWVFYHDALTQLKDRKCVAWMKTQKDVHGVTYYDRWLTPKYLDFDTPPGNSPEIMAWDAQLNNDVKESIKYHALCTASMVFDKSKSVEENPKFDTSTPKRQDWVIRRLMDVNLTGPEEGVPCSRRICEDTKRCFSTHLLAIHKSKGCRIDEHSEEVKALGDVVRIQRQGHRRKNKGGHGGKRVRSQDYDTSRWIHPIARQASWDGLERSIERFYSTASP